MVFRPAPNIVQLVAQYISNNEVCENVYHYSSGGPPDSTSINALIDAFIAWENSSGKPMRTSNTALQRIIATDLSSSSGALVDRAVLPQVTGTAAGTQCPNNVTFVISWHTGKRGRSYRGRTYHIGMPTSFQNLNQLVVGQAGTNVSLYNGLLTLGVAPIFHLQVLSGRQGGVDINPRIATPVTAATCDNFLDSQRRRLSGR